MREDRARHDRKGLSSVLWPLSSDTGFTLIELMMTIVILGFLSMILVPFFTSITRSPDPMIRQRAVALGQALMDEILSKKWDAYTPNGGGPLITSESPAPAPASCTPTCTGNRLFCYICTHPTYTPGSATGSLGREAGETSATDRTTWDDVDDYNLLSEPSVPNGPFYDQNNVAFTLNGYTRNVRVAYIASNSNPIDATTSTSGQPTDTKRIIVTVTSPRGETFTLVAVVCNF